MNTELKRLVVERNKYYEQLEKTEQYELSIGYLKLDDLS